jgi:hypothetical protein
VLSYKCKLLPDLGQHIGVTQKYTHTDTGLDGWTRYRRVTCGLAARDCTTGPPGLALAVMYCNDCIGGTGGIQVTCHLASLPATGINEKVTEVPTPAALATLNSSVLGLFRASNLNLFYNTEHEYNGLQVTTVEMSMASSLNLKAKDLEDCAIVTVTSFLERNTVERSALCDACKRCLETVT